MEMSHCFPTTKAIVHRAHETRCTGGKMIRSAIFYFLGEWTMKPGESLPLITDTQRLKKNLSLLLGPKNPLQAEILWVQVVSETKTVPRMLSLGNGTTLGWNFANFCNWILNFSMKSRAVVLVVLRFPRDFLCRFMHIPLINPTLH